MVRQSSPDFQALNSTFKPIPSLFDKPHEEKEFGKKDMDIWKKEVIKLVIAILTLSRFYLYAQSHKNVPS